MFTINEKRHIKNFFHTIIFFLIPFKKIGIRKKKQILLQLNQQTIQFIHKTFFLQINRKKTFLFFLKKQDTKILQKNNGKKTVIVFHQSIEKKSSNELKKNLKSDKTFAHWLQYKIRFFTVNYNNKTK